jgi:hypothetical protein
MEILTGIKLFDIMKTGSGNCHKYVYLGLFENKMQNIRNKVG